VTRDSLAPEIAALRRLFRRLNDVASLRGNPLAMQLFGVSNHEVLDAGAIHQRIRSKVMAALESMTPPLEDRSRSAEYARRLRTIVERCDLLGEPRSIVAADLGICERHLYRDRHEAFARLADVLRHTGIVREPQVTSISGSIGDVELRLNLVKRLDSAGRFCDARAVLESLANQQLPPAQRALVTHRLVQALCDAGSVVEGRVVLDSAKHELAKAGCGESELRIIRSEMLAAEALLAKEAGEMSSAIDCAERALAMLRPYHGPNRERARSLAVELSVVLAGALCEAGAFERAVRTVESAKAFVDERLDPAIVTSLHFHSGQAHVLLPWGLNVALQENHEAFAIASRSGHARHEAIALGNFSMIHFLSGNYADAMQYGQKALLVSEHVAAPIDLAQELTHVARVAIALGNAVYGKQDIRRDGRRRGGRSAYGSETVRRGSGGSSPSVPRLPRLQCTQAPRNCTVRRSARVCWFNEKAKRNLCDPWRDRRRRKPRDRVFPFASLPRVSRDHR
jgi:tetratricopeptide (TPR) repeat protein